MLFNNYVILIFCACQLFFAIVHTYFNLQRALNYVILYTEKHLSAGNGAKEGP